MSSNCTTKSRKYDDWMPLPDSVEHKFYRCVKHFQELQCELEEYYKTNPCGMVREPDSPPDRPLFTFKTFKPIPARFGLIVGDFLQNLRSSLDYLVWELVLANGNRPDKFNMFPICSTRIGFEKAIISNRLRGIDPAAVALIEELQPYRLAEADRKKAVLFVLDNLTSINKHRHVLLTNMQSYITSGLPTIENNGHLWADIGRLTSDDYPRRNLPVDPDEPQVNAQLLVFISLNEQSMEDVEIVRSMDILAMYIKDNILSRFERFFA